MTGFNPLKLNREFDLKFQHNSSGKNNRRDQRKSRNMRPESPAATAAG